MKKFGAPLSAELRGKYEIKTMRPVKGDGVRIVRGGFKGIEGKITGLDSQKGKLYVEGVTREIEKGGKSSPFPIDSSKVMITTLNLDDKIRRARVERGPQREEES